MYILGKLLEDTFPNNL